MDSGRNGFTDFPEVNAGFGRLMGELVRSVFLGKTAGNIAVGLLLVGAVYLFGFREARFFRIPSASMEPTLLPVDQIMTMAESSYDRGEIVVIREPDGSGNFFVKRIVGVGGDEIAVYRGALHINGEFASEPYIAEPMHYEMPIPVVVPEDHVFVLGDNRNNSLDSHDAGESYPTSLIVGRVRYIYYPYERFGSVPTYPLTNRLGQ